MLPVNPMSHCCSVSQAVTAVPFARESFLFASQECIAARYPGEQLMPAGPGSYFLSLAQRVHCCLVAQELTAVHCFLLAQSNNCCLLAQTSLLLANLIPHCCSLTKIGYAAHLHGKSSFLARPESNCCSLPPKVIAVF